MSEFRFAIMGAGLIAPKFVRAVGLLENCCVCAIASRSQERAQAFADKMNIPAAYGSYEEMLIKEKPDCVYIATSTDLHAELSLLCVSHGIPVLCEKAMCRNSAEAEAVFAAAREKGVFVMEALWARFLPCIMKARQWVMEGRIGKPALASFEIGFVAPEDPTNRFFSPAKGGGAMYDISVYGHHLLSWTLNQPVASMSAEVTFKHGVDAAEIVLLRMGDGTPAAIHSTFLAPMNECMVITGSAGRIVVPSAHNLCYDAYLYDTAGKEVEHFVDNETRNGFTYEAQEVMDCIRAGKFQSDVVTHQSTLDCAKMFDMIASKAK